jgi:hypothetical protein
MNTPENRSAIEDRFPNLASVEHKYEVISDKTDGYNCISFVAGDESIPWEPFQQPYTYWPPGASEGYHVESLVEAYEQVGFSKCHDNEDGRFEDGIEKVAIYVDQASGDWTHAAIQRANGMWASKLGTLHDIEHASLDGIACAEYGYVKCFMFRRRAQAG